MPFTLAALTTEINTDPTALGYAALKASGNDQGIADLLNIVRATISVKRPDCSPAEILEAIDLRDFPASPTGVASVPLAQSWLESVTQFARIRLTNDDGTKTTTRKNFDRLVNDTQGSQTRLDAVAVRTGSRAEQLFGAGVFVTPTNVANALGRF